MSEPTTIKEGLAEILSVEQDGSKAKKQNVFYNPSQVYNRDLSVLVLNAFTALRKKETTKDLEVLEALSASGIRSIRYAKEVSHLASIVANDRDETAVEHIRKNCVHNSIPPEKILVKHADANVLMYQNITKANRAYDIIDLDPYGTVAPFLDAAVQAVRDGGMLCITSTDMPVLGGNCPETCFYRYGGTALKSKYVHEMSLRIILNAVCRAAGRVQRHVEPLCSFSIDFYVRLFVRIVDSPLKTKTLASNTSIVYQCVQCENYHTQHFGDITQKEKNVKYRPARVNVPAICEQCGGQFSIGGPFYSGPLHNKEFVASLITLCQEKTLVGISSWKKVHGLVTAINEESSALLHFTVPGLCSVLRIPAMPLRKFKSALMSVGYTCTHFHREPNAIKTDAPSAVVFDILRLWAKDNPPKNCPMPQVLAKECVLKSTDVDWDFSPGADEPKTKIARFLPNPAPCWGPKPRARPDGAEKEGEEKKDGEIMAEKAEKVEEREAEKGEKAECAKKTEKPEDEVRETEMPDGRETNKPECEVKESEKSEERETEVEKKNNVAEREGDENVRINTT